MNIPLLDLKREYADLETDILSAITKVISEGRYIMGKEVFELEKKIAEYVGTKHAVACGNGTDALVLSLMALGIGSGDEVITSTFTYYATAESIAAVGAKPVFVDVDINTYNLNVKDIESKINGATKAIIPVHIFGQPADMDSVVEIAKKYDLKIIEDVAQGIGAKYKGKRVGSIGDLGTFSFFPTKNLGAFGDAGIITTDSDECAIILKALRNHGSGQVGKTAYQYLNEIEDDGVEVSKYYNYLVGFNSRLDTVQAAVLNVKFEHLNDFNDKRRHLAKSYDLGLGETSLVTPVIDENVESIYHLYIVQSDRREELINYLADEGISTGVYYPVPLHLQKVFEHLGYKKGDFPNAEYLSERTFALPLFPKMTKEEQTYIIEKIKKFE